MDEGRFRRAVSGNSGSVGAQGETASMAAGSSRTGTELLWNESSARADTPRILCVDDDPNLLNGLCRVLGFDFEVVTENNPLAALDRLERDPDFQVVLSDLKMPQIDGTLFLARTQRLIPEATRLLLTGEADLPSAIAAINEAGVFRFLSKPCAGDQLVDAVRAAVDQNRVISAANAANPLPPGTFTSMKRSLARPRTPQGSEPFRTPLLTPVGTPVLGAGGSGDGSQTRRACARPGSLLALLADVAGQALDEGRTKDAERVLAGPLETLLKNARAGRATNEADCDAAAVLAARLAGISREGSWLDYPFLLFTALRRLLPSRAIDEIQAASHHVRRANPTALQLYLSALELHSRGFRPAERCLLKRIQQCRALLAAAV
jgi:DNA-binding NarL/FixJ family response regulator